MNRFRPNENNCLEMSNCQWCSQNSQTSSIHVVFVIEVVQNKNSTTSELVAGHLPPVFLVAMVTVTAAIC